HKMNNLLLLSGTRGMAACVILYFWTICARATAQPTSDTKPNATAEATQWVYPMENRPAREIISEEEFAKY
ncbi:MAG: hypothetical protein KDE47_08965, partial [Caldilineaceae bacterium]|nr:hypothetical protein [Caldilineaceae bacterium]